MHRHWPTSSGLRDWCIVVVCLWSYTFHLRYHASETTTTSPFELENDGDLLVLVREIMNRRGEGTARITKVKGHADEDTVLAFPVLQSDRVGNDRADEAADFGRRRVELDVIDS